MRQVLHIFRKDVRRLWIQIVFVLLILGPFVRAQHGQGHAMAVSASAWGLATALAALILPLACWVLIARLIHQEPLVGDNQFWITRPYSWRSLLAAKVMFTIMFVNLPLFASDCIILATNGFSPWSQINGLLWRQLLLTAVFWAPAAAVASVTRGVGQFVFTSLAAAIFGLLISTFYLASSLSQTWVRDTLAVTLLALVACAVLLGQYARRATLISRLTLIGGAVFIAVVYSPKVWWPVFAAQYRDSSALQITFDPSPQRQPRESEFPGRQEAVAIDLPLELRGIDPGTRVAVDAMKMTIAAPGGKEWHSEWQAWLPLVQENPRVRFYVDERFLEQVKSEGAKVHIALKLALLRQANVTEVRASDPQPYVIPAVGRCYYFGGRQESLFCTAPLKKPSPALVTAQVTKTCDNKATESPQVWTERQVWESREWSPYPAEFGMSPLTGFNSGIFQSEVHTCPESRLTFIKEQPVAYLSRELDIDGIRLKDYVIRVQ